MTKRKKKESYFNLSKPLNFFVFFDQFMNSNNKMNQQLPSMVSERNTGISAVNNHFLSGLLILVESRSVIPTLTTVLYLPEGDYLKHQYADLTTVQENIQISLTNLA